MKNLTTPRTLSECTFTIGHPAVEHAAHRERRPHHRAELVIYALFAGFLLAVAWGKL